MIVKPIFSLTSAYIRWKIMKNYSSKNYEKTLFQSCLFEKLKKHFWKKSPYLRLQPDKARPEFPQLEPEKSGHDSIFVDLVGACWCCVHCCRRLAPQSFLPLLKKKKQNVPINFHFAKQVNSSANKGETDFFSSIFLSNWP